jgi:hypothetical protein
VDHLRQRVVGTADRQRRTLLWPLMIEPPRSPSTIARASP